MSGFALTTVVKATGLNSIKKGLNTNLIGASKFTSTSASRNHLEHIQRIKEARPRSPWYIYQPQLTAILSIAHRASGVGLGLGFYALTAAYPAFGVTSDVAASFLSTVPEAAKIAGKFVIAFPFMFHNFNGIRHLIWDTASSLTMKGVYSSGYMVLGASVISSLGLASL